MKFLTLLLLLVTSLAHSQLRPAQTQYLKERGALFNPSFEQGVEGWTVSGCSATVTSDVPLLNKTLQITCVAQTLSLKQEVTTLADFVGQKGEFDLHLKTDVGGVKVSGLENGTRVGTVEFSSSANYQRTPTTPFNISSTSNGIEVYSDAPITGTIYVDNVYVGFNNSSLPSQAGNEGSFLTTDGTDASWSSAISGTLNPVSEWEDCGFTDTTLSTWTLSIAGTECVFRRVGDSMEVKGQIRLNGTPNAVNLQIFIPQGNLIDSTKIGTTGLSTFDLGIASLNESGVQNRSGRVRYLDSNLDRVEIADSGNNNVLGNVNSTSPYVWGNNDRVHFSFKVPIQGWSSGVDAAATVKELTAETDNILSASFSGSLGASIAAITEKYSGALSCSFVSTGVFDCSINTPLTVNPAINCTETGSAVSLRDCGIQNITPSSFRVRIWRSDTITEENRDFSVTIHKQGADVNKSQVIAGTFSQIEEVDTVLDATTANEFSARLDNGGNILSENLNWIDGGCSQVSSVITCNFVAGLFPTQAPSCTGTSYGVGNNDSEALKFRSLTQTGFSYVVSSSGNGALARSASVKCSKQGADVNKSIKGAVVQASSLGVKCQTKFLSGNSTTSGVLTDTVFNVDNAKKYNVNFQVHGASGFDVLLSDGSTNIARVRMTSSTGNAGSSRICVSPTGSKFQLVQNNANQVNGNGTGTDTFITVCELPDNYNCNHTF